MTPRIRRAFAFLALIGIVSAADSSEPRRDNNVVRPFARAQAGGADRAAAVVRSQTGGRVLSVNQEKRSGRTVYRVKVLLTGGQVRVLRVDPATGRIVR